jgi:ADP-ribose pyrophosphatase YjhB (NUDIX family)
MTHSPSENARRVLAISDELRAMAALGLHYAANIYDTDRFERLRQLALELQTLVTGETLAQVTATNSPVIDHPTPFACGDGAVFDDQGRILLIRRADTGRWAMPGGALEVGETAAQGSEREVFEETGVRCRATQLVGVFDGRLWRSTSRYHLYQFVFICEPLDTRELGHGSHANEVKEVGWFAQTDLPPDLEPNHIGRIPIAFAVYRGERTAHIDM